jgi:hypothetical protein
VRLVLHCPVDAPLCLERIRWTLRVPEVPKPPVVESDAAVVSNESLPPVPDASMPMMEHIRTLTRVMDAMEQRQEQQLSTLLAQQERLERKLDTVLQLLLLPKTTE